MNPLLRTALGSNASFHCRIVAHRGPKWARPLVVAPPDPAREVALAAGGDEPPPRVFDDRQHESQHRRRDVREQAEADDRSRPRQHQHRCRLDIERPQDHAGARQQGRWKRPQEARHARCRDRPGEIGFGDGDAQGGGRVTHRRQRHRLPQIGVLDDVAVDGADHAVVVKAGQHLGFVGLGVELDADVHGVAPVSGHQPVVVLGQEPLVPVPAPGEEIVETGRATGSARNRASGSPRRRRRD